MCAQNMEVILDSIVNTKSEGRCAHFKKKRNFTVTSTPFASRETPILHHKLIIFTVCKC